MHFLRIPLRLCAHWQMPRAQGPRRWLGACDIPRRRMHPSSSPPNHHQRQQFSPCMHRQRLEQASITNPSLNCQSPHSTETVSTPSVVFQLVSPLRLCCSARAISETSQPCTAVRKDNREFSRLDQSLFCSSPEDVVKHAEKTGYVQVSELYESPLVRYRFYPSLLHAQS